MRAEDLCRDLSVEAVRGDLAGLEISGVAHDSRSVRRGDLFCCVVGASADGHDHAAEAVERGAVALLVQRELELGVPEVEVLDVRRAMALAAASLHRWPSRRLRVVGITGTNGKTTTSHMLATVLDHAGEEVRVLGTLSGPRTTPEAPELQAMLAAWVDEGVSAVVMEVSSHALALGRVEGMRFAAAIFTNLSRDHLDFHESMEAYFQAKAALFTPDMSDLAVVNLDSPYGRLLRDAATIPTVGYGLAQAVDLEVGVSGSSFRWRGHGVEVAMAGRFNVSNALAAAEAAIALGVPAEVVASGLSRVGDVPGRFERISTDEPFTVVVDYAHTPDGLENVLAAATEIAPEGQVTVVFGCGGDRDHAKRPMMGAVAAAQADRVVLTADNSRGERTSDILDEVREGFERAEVRRAAQLVVDEDRRRAIAGALREARPGDVVVVAGKGHEATITIGDSVEPFDDRQVVREELAAISASGGAGGARS